GPLWLETSSGAWYIKIEGYFNEEKFEKCSHEHTLFVKHERNGKIIIVSLYVDDLICTGNDMHMIHAFKESMKKKFAMTDLGKMKYFLGVEVIQSEKGKFINQHKYAVEILKKFDAREYKQMVGSLMYLLAIRLDIAYSVCLVARYMDRPIELHVTTIKRIMRYLKGTLVDGIMYSHRTNKIDLVGWSDSDYAGDLDDMKSTSGYVFMLGTGAISWSSKKQPIVTLSTTEAEYVAASICACQCLWLRSIMSHLKFEQSKPTVIYCDNSSCIKLSKNPIMHDRCKHIDVRFHFLRNLAKEGTMELKHCTSQEKLADLMTKLLKLDTFHKLKIGLWTINAQKC
ncbi:copia-type polyprotein, partial [Trifolium pratense]